LPSRLASASRNARMLAGSHSARSSAQRRASSGCASQRRSDRPSARRVMYACAQFERSPRAAQLPGSLETRCSTTGWTLVASHERVRQVCLRARCGGCSLGTSEVVSALQSQHLHTRCKLKSGPTAGGAGHGVNLCGVVILLLPDAVAHEPIELPRDGLRGVGSSARRPPHRTQATVRSCARSRSPEHGTRRAS